MQQLHQQFKLNIAKVRELETLHTHLQDNLKFPNDLSDLLRAMLVYGVSALDKLIHELVQKGMTQTFTGNRVATRKYNDFSLSMRSISDIQNATIPPAEHLFALEIYNKNKKLSFQTPDNISDALSYIWDEEHKWQRITTEMGMVNQNMIRTTLKAIVDRRNQIVHEADLNYNGDKNSILKNDIIANIDFIEKLGDSIYKLVKYT